MKKEWETKVNMGSSQVLGEANMGHQQMEAITSQSNHTRIRRIQRMCRYETVHMKMTYRN